jgi:hypothetical protein
MRLACTYVVRRNTFCGVLAECQERLHYVLRIMIPRFDEVRLSLRALSPGSTKQKSKKPPDACMAPSRPRVHKAAAPITILEAVTVEELEPGRLQRPHVRPDISYVELAFLFLPYTPARDLEHVQ